MNDKEAGQVSIYMDDMALWRKALEKAGRPQINRSISQIIRRLLEMWLAGEVIPFKNEVQQQ